MAGEAADAGGGGAVALGVCERTFRRYVDRYEDEGLDGLVDKRLGQVSARRAPVDEVVRTEAMYHERYDGLNVAHFYSFYRRRHAGERSYTWVKNTLQRAGLVAKAPGRGKHRRRRERAPLAGMMLHQDGSIHLSPTWAPRLHRPCRAPRKPDSLSASAASRPSAVSPIQTHGKPRARRIGVAAQRRQGRRYPAALQPRDRRLRRAEPPRKLRLRQLRRRTGTHQRLDQRELVVGPRILLPELRILHEALLQLLQLRHRITCLIRSLAVANVRRGVLRDFLTNTCGTTTRRPVAVT